MRLQLQHFSFSRFGGRCETLSFNTIPGGVDAAGPHDSKVSLVAQVTLSWVFTTNEFDLAKEKNEKGEGGNI